MRKLSWYVLSFAFAGCGDDSATKTPDAFVMPDAPVETLGPAPELAMACSDSMTDVYTLPSGLPTMSDSHRGDVFRCSTGESLSAYKVNAQIEAYNANFTNATAGKATSGFWTFRIAYRSERNTVTNARAEGDMAAFLLVPEKPLAGAPLIVFGHGSVGAAPKCAPSLHDLNGPARDDDYPPALLRLAGAGYTVISPDYAGFSYGQTPGYFNAEDEAHAILDATRAAAKILKTPPAKVAFVGHSQGGHAVIAAQSYAESYGMTGELIGVATFAPYWVSLSLLTAAATDTGGLSTAAPGDIGSIVYAMAYAYSELELREGAGHGLDAFDSAKAAAAKDAILGGECYDATKIAALGAKPSEFFDTNYVNSVGGACALSGSCSDPLAQKWKGYWISERPPIDSTGAPMLIFTGPKDTFINQGRAQCAHDAFDTALSASGSTTTVTYCSDPAATHREFVRRDDVDYALQWIASKAGIGSAPAACTPPDPTFCASIPKDY